MQQIPQSLDVLNQDIRSLSLDETEQVGGAGPETDYPISPRP
jgi:hypothetical protein